MHGMHLRSVLSLGNFFCAAQFFLILYVLAPYLATVLPDEQTGFVIAAGAAMTLIAFPFVPRLVRRFGPRVLTLALIALAASSLFLLSLGPQLWGAIALVMIFCSVQPLIGYLLDLMLESTVESEQETGRIRTLFLTCGNTALVLAPFAVSYVLGPTDAYTRVFLLGALSLIPAFTLLSFARVPTHVSPSFASMQEVYRCLVHDTDVRAVGIAHATLQFFYSLAPFFIPLYLHTILGMPWSELGVLLAISLVPFVLLEYPIGWIADRAWGDQELMAMGFLIIGSSFAAIAFVTTETPVLTLLITLVLTRVGAALAEATSESHFFRRVSEKDINSVGIFRMLRPFGSVTAPVVGSLFLLFSTYNIFFFVCGIAILIIGVGSALSIKDVR